MTICSLVEDCSTAIIVIYRFKMHIGAIHPITPARLHGPSPIEVTDSTHFWRKFRGSGHLALPCRNLGGVQFVPGHQLGDRLVTLNGLQCALRLELSREPSAVSSWWIILFVIKSTLTACLRNRDHLHFGHAYMTFVG